MAENTFEAVSSGENNSSKEPVCIDAQRVYDSCGDKDCLTDLRVYFTESAQAEIDAAVNVRIRDTDIITVLVDIEPVPFHRGFYSIDMTYFFEVCLDVFMSPGSSPIIVSGLSVYSKKVILYGSEGNVRVFSSELSCDEYDTQNISTRNLPVATVQVARPIALSAKLRDNCSRCAPPCKVPECICSRFGGNIVGASTKSVYATIGVFSIVQLERNVQMLIPAYDFCVPEKACVTSSDNPCEMFSRLEFPTNEFFPPNVTELTGEESSTCGCHGTSRSKEV